VLNANIHDHYEERYFHKLWEMLPAVYRTADEAPQTGTGALRAFVRLMAQQAAVLQRSVDRLWDDEFIATCDDWVIPYIADLVGTNVVIEGLPSVWRRDVANTIFYRRRKGTPAVLEQIAFDITGWHAKMVEFFRQLGRTRHLLDPVPQGLEGVVSKTGIGGYADLRSVSAAELRGAAFDEYFYTADVRIGRGVQGRYNIPKLGVFVWRLRAYPIEQGTAFEVAPGFAPRRFTFDPTGRDIPLFAAGERPHALSWVSPEELEVPTPIRCRLLAEHAPELYADDQLPRSLAVFTSGALVRVSAIQSANLHDWTPTATGKRFLIDPERGRLKQVGNPDTGEVQVSYYYGFSGDIGAGPYERRLTLRESVDATVTGGGNALQTPLLDAQVVDGYVISIADNATYTPVPDVEEIHSLTVQAENQKRPTVRLDADWTLTAAANVDATLRLDGLLVSGGHPIVLTGNYEEVVVTHCTLDPGGAGITTTFEQNARGEDLKPTRLVIQGHVKRLVVTSSILGGIVTAADGVVEHLDMQDSIVQSVERAQQAVSLSQGEALVNRCTILGRARFHQLYASEVILYGAILVDNQQDGCLRFSAWVVGEPDPDPLVSTVPRPYESVALDAATPLFASTRFGDPHYAQLSQSAPQEIRGGASDGSEMGAFASLKNPIKERSLLIKYHEFMPFGLVPVVLYAT
jgi:hypothetical protein